MKRYSKSSLFIALIGALMLVFGCERERVQPVPQAPNLDGLKTDLGDTSMTDAEFKVLYDRVGEIQAAKAADPSQPQAAWLYQNQRYKLTYSTTVAVGIGGAYYNASTNTLSNGGVVGGVTIDPATFDQVFTGLSKDIRLIIQPSWFDLTQVTIVLVDKGNASYNGLFNFATGEYLFLGLGVASNGSCGAIGLSRVYGKLTNLTSSFQNIIAGQAGSMLILGCNPVAVSGSLDFAYTGVAIP
jgi:hypothetical protein